MAKMVKYGAGKGEYIKIKSRVTLAGNLQCDDCLPAKTTELEFLPQVQ